MNISGREMRLIKLFAASFLLVAASAAFAAGAPSGNFLVADGTLGDKVFVLKLIGVAAGIFAVNALLSWFLLRRDLFASHLLAGATLLFSALLFVKIAAVVYL